MTALEWYEQLFSAYRVAMNERIARWSAIQRKYRDLLQGAKGATAPTHEEYVAYYAAEEAVAQAEREISEFITSKFDFVIPPHIRS